MFIFYSIHISKTGIPHPFYLFDISKRIIPKISTTKPIRLIEKGLAVAKYRKILKTQGIRGLYRGIGVVLFFSFPGGAIYYGAYEVSNKLLEKRFGENRFSNYCLAGSIADIISSFIYTPMEVLKLRNQGYADQQLSGSSKNEIKSSFQEIRSILAKEGPFGFYRGYWVLLFEYLPYSAFFFSVFEGCRRYSYSFFYDGVTTSSSYGYPLSINLFSSYFASTLSAILTSPIEIIRTRIQVFIDCQLESKTKILIRFENRPIVLYLVVEGPLLKVL